MNSCFSFHIRRFRTTRHSFQFWISTCNECANNNGTNHSNSLRFNFGNFVWMWFYPKGEKKTNQKQVNILRERKVVCVGSMWRDILMMMMMMMIRQNKYNSIFAINRIESFHFVLFSFLFFGFNILHQQIHNWQFRNSTSNLDTKTNRKKNHQRKKKQQQNTESKQNCDKRHRTFHSKTK